MARTTGSGESASVWPTAVIAAAPMVICRAPARPEAVPARRGSTLTVPAKPLGMLKPWPTDMAPASRKKPATSRAPASSTASSAAAMAIEKAVPMAIMRSEPTLAPILAETMLPAM